jgi:putative ABC transport system permease protein
MTLLRDVRFAARTFLHDPTFSVTAILTLALGIGASTAMFSLVNGVVLRRLPFPASERLVAVLSEPKTAGDRSRGVSAGDFLDWQAHNRVFEEMAAFTGGVYNLTDAGDPERLLGAAVTSRFFETVGVRPLVGGTFAPVNGQPERSDIVMLGASLWRRRFHADPSIVGRSVRLDGQPMTVVGVMPDGVTFPRDVMGGRLTEPLSVWRPLPLAAGERSLYFLQVIARLKPHVSVDQAQAGMSAICTALEQQFAQNRAYGVKLESLHEHLVRPVRTLLFVFVGAVSFLLLIACVNVANLALARVVERQREFAIRLALGAGRRRLVRQLLTENVALALLGGVAGLVIAHWTLTLVVALLPPDTLPRLAEVEMDGQALVLTLLVSLVCGVLLGIVPMFQASNTEVATTIKMANAPLTTRSRVLNVLVVAEVASAFVLLTGAGLMMRSFLRLTSVDVGFDANRTVAARVVLPEAGYPSAVELRRFSTTVLDHLRREPGVAHAGAVNWLPFGGPLLTGGIAVEDVNPVPQGLAVAKPAVRGDYFQVLGIPLLRGRVFDDSDTDRTAGVAIASEQLARRLWPGQDALGKRVYPSSSRPAGQPWLTVVGVVGDVKQTTFSEKTRPALYVPILQVSTPFLLRNLAFVVGTPDEPDAVAAAVRRAIRAADPTMPLGQVELMTRLLAKSVSEPRFRTFVLGVFAAAALGLVATGLLGVLGNAVTRRTREIGVRMAVGAHHADLIRLVLRHALGLTLIGVALGGLASAGLVGLLTAFLFEITPADPMTFVASAAILTLIALLASYLPARRATRVDPLTAIRAN